MDSVTDLKPSTSRLAVAALAAALAAGAPATAAPAPGTGFRAEAAAREGIAHEPFAALEREIAAGRFPKTTSVLVLRHDRLVYERYFGEGGPDVLNDTRSATKSITALAVGAALADGAIGSLEQPAFGFLSDLAPFAHDDPLKRGITLRDLLTMSSALDCNDDVDDSPGNEDHMYPEPRWARFAVDLPTKDGYARDAAGLGPFSYCTAGAFLLGQILERATHRPVDAYVGERLLRPLGIRRAEWPHSPSGEVMTGGGLRLTSRDLATLATLVRNRGQWHGRALLPAAYVDAAVAPQRRANPAQEYGYLFWRSSFDSACGAHVAAYMGGNGGNSVLVFDDLAAVVVVTRRNYNTRGMHRETKQLVEDHVLKAFCAS